MPTDKNIKTPEKLYSYFEKYKDYCKQNPKKENIWNSRSEKEVSLNREIPITWVGFENYLRKQKVITTLQDYEFNKDERYNEYITIVRAIKDEIYEDKNNGAVTGIFQHNIIARDLGLVDKKDVEHKGSAITINVNDNKAEEGLKEVLGETDS